MFLFYSSKQTDENRSYYKGVLFEELLRRYLDSSGYDVEIRRKHNSLEYDIEGTDRASGMRIIGEAKAHGTAISGHDFSSFVGKILPRGLSKGEIRGLFLSTSALTPDADDYYDTVRDFGVVAHTGQQLANAIVQALRLPEQSEAFRSLEQKEFDPKQYLLLTTDSGEFIAVTAGNVSSAAASVFGLLRPDGRMVDDPRFLEALSASVPELQALSPIAGTVATTASRPRDIQRGLTLGSDWADYRLPAAPEYFVGRDVFLQELREHIASGEPPFVIQIKSRSGVGKSSVLASLERQLTADGARTEIHDARDVKSVLDVQAVVQRYTEIRATPADFRALAQSLGELGACIGEQRAVLIVDQFESTFNNPDVFYAYEAIASLHGRLGPSMYFVLARKNDQLTTFDESHVSLGRLSEMSRSFELRDFTSAEARELINRINSASPNPVSQTVLAYVFEFAQGFPWLIRRTMAHLMGLAGTGVSQRELFETGLRLDDLFDEELEGLDEIERDYLVRVAARLPADYNQLQRQFDEDPLLARMLDRLTRTRLLRLTGSTYDTYNDVFKEYLVYRKLPEFRQPVIYRMYPRSVIATFREIAELRSFSTEELEAKLELARGSAFNRIRELRNLNLIRKDGSGWSIPQTVLDVYGQGRLGEYARRQLAENDIAARLVSHAVQGNPIHVDDLPNFLQQQLPFVEASEDTWVLYAAILRSWLAATRLLLASQNGKLIPPETPRDRLLEDLGNLGHLAAGGRRTASGLWLPSTPFSTALLVARKLLAHEIPKGSQERKAHTDLRTAGLIQNGAPIFDSEAEFRDLARDLLVAGDFDNIWEAAGRNAPLMPVFETLVGGSLAESTLRWYLKQLVSWAKAVDVIEARRYTYKPRSSSRRSR